MEYGIIILSNLAMQLPVFIALLVGLVIAMVTWKRNPKPSLWATIGILLMIFLGGLGSLTNVLPLILNSRNNISMTQIGRIITVIGIVLTVFRAGAWAFIIAAVFSGRKRSE